MKAMLRILLLAMCMGCTTTASDPSTMERTLPVDHPLADGVRGKLVLRDGKTVTGRIRWKAVTREYIVVPSTHHLAISADRVIKIEIEPNVEQTPAGDSPKAAPEK